MNSKNANPDFSWWKALAGPYALIALWAAVAIYLSAADPVIGNSDMFAFIPRAETMSLDKLSPWVNGFYPFGYPLLLKALFPVTGDYDVSGRVVSIVSAVVALVAVYRTSRSVFDSSVGLLALVICCTNPSFMAASVMSGTDMPAAALLALGVYFACRFSVTSGRRHLLASGVSIGASYLIRYNALTLVPAVVLWLWLRPASTISSAHRFRRCLWFLAGFVLAASPQFVLSFVDQGTPLYNLQAQNVYFGMFGEGNWGQNMAVARSVNALSEIVRQHPWVFLSHWFSNLLRVPGLNLLQFPLGVVSVAGIIVSLKRPATRDSSWLLFLIFAAYTAAICMAFPNARLLLFSTGVLSIYAASGLLALVPRHVTLSAPIPLRAPCVVALTAWLLWTDTLPRILHPLPEYDRNRINVSALLSAQGVESSSDVLAFSFDYYDMTKPTKDRYAIPWYATDFRPYGSVDDMAGRMQGDRQRFLVFDQNAPYNVRGLEAIWPFDQTAMSRRFQDVMPLSGSVHVYRLRN